MNAIEHNRSLGYSKLTWEKIQATIGADVDGIPGEQTSQRLVLWQAVHGISPPTGRLDRATWRTLEAHWQRLGHHLADNDDGVAGDAANDDHEQVVNTWTRGLARMRLRLWWDLSEPLTLRNLGRLTRALTLMGVHTVAIMLDSSAADERPRWRWSPKGLEEFTAVLSEHDIEVHLTSWPRPTRTFIDATLEGIIERLEISGATVWEFDLEHNWAPKLVEDYATLKAAADSLLRGARSLAIPLWMTTFPLHAELGAGSTLAHRLDAVAVQAYSRHKQGDANYRWGAPYGPGDLQEMSIERVRALNRSVICGLGAWDQKFPHRTIAEAMDTALGAAFQAGVTHVSYWSAKWILPGSQYHQDDVEAYFKDLFARRTDARVRYLGA